MSNDIKRLGQSLNKDSVETGHNTRRISAELPLIERKLDVVSVDRPYTLDFPLTEKTHAVQMNLQIKPDNCCDCVPGAEGAQRYGVGFADYFYDQVLTKIPGFGGMYSYPVHPLENGVDYPAHYKDPMDQTGSVTNIWFAWEGYPFFYPTVTNPFGYGSYAVRHEDTGGIIVPANGVYSSVFTNRAGGFSTNTSQIIAAIKRLPHDKEDIPENWETISRKIYSTERGNICTYTFKEWADGWGLYYEKEDIIEIGGSLCVKVCASNSQNITFTQTVLDQVGGLYIRVYAYCYPLNAGDVVGGWLKANDVDGWSPMEMSTDQNQNSLSIDLIGLGFGAITGVVRDQDSAPIWGATVSYVGGSARDDNSGETLTNDEGRYTFYEMPPDVPFLLTASKDNYTSQTKEITTVFNTVVQLDFQLTHL